MKHEHLEHDLGVAAFLVVKGFRLIGLVPGGQGHYSFEFEDPGGRAREAAMDYLRGEPVSARELVNAQKSLKNLLYNAKSPRNGHDNGNSNAPPAIPKVSSKLPSTAPTQPVQTFSRFKERIFPPKEPLVEGLLYCRDIVALGGRRRHGKTTFIGNLSFALTLPRPDFLGFTISRPARVLAIFLEDDAGELQMKMTKMAKDGSADDRLALYTREDLSIARIPIDITNQRFTKFIIEKCKAHRPDLIILDNLAQFIGADYNNSKLIHRAMSFVWELTRDFDAAVIIAAHPRKRDKKSDSFGQTAVSLRNDPEGFFEEIMGSSHFVNSCGSLWGIERNLDTNRTDFLGGTQRFNGQQSIMTLEKDEDDWLCRVSDLEINLPLVLNTRTRKQAWQLLPESPFSYSEGEKLVKPAMKSSSTFHAWFDECKRLKVIVAHDGKYVKATVAQPKIVEVSS